MIQKNDKSLISVRDLTFSYRTGSSFFSSDSVKVLSEFNFDLNRGDRVGVVGRNGEGKSTLLRIMAGIFDPDQGVVIRRSGLTISLLALGVGFNPLLTGRDNVILSAVLQGRTERWALERMDKICSFSELGDSFDRPVRTYSAGMRARLAFSTAICMDVDVLLIDETLTVGDTSFQIKATAALDAKFQSGLTAVLVSHSPQQIRRVCSRAIWIDDGRLREEGAVVDVLASYESAGA